MAFHFRKNSMLHCNLHNINLSYILCLSFEFTFAIQLFCIQHLTFIYVDYEQPLFFL